ncbi:hemolysin XhlA family protein [Paenibacillus yanchengensis]|uniref:Hemolysin XhlA family protein n=1 Tax=Paenibacillus yanchengensis TaxID=2035833 RepID=A0ABW4YIX1_9BACL
MPDKEIQLEILQRLTRVETQLGDMNKEFDRSRHANQLVIEAMSLVKNSISRLEKIEDNQKWLWRTITGAVVVAVVSFIIGGGLNL